MNFFDYLLIGVVGLSMVLSLWRGFVREIISLIGLVAAFLVASRASGYAGDFMVKSAWLTNGTVADIAGFVLVFVLIMLVVGIVGAIVRKLVDMADLTATDRTLGLFFGMARGLLLISLSFLIYTSYAKPDMPMMKNSLLTPYAIQMGDMLGQLIPADYPFSRQGKEGKLASSPNKPSQPGSADSIPAQDKKQLMNIIQQNMK